MGDRLEGPGVTCAQAMAAVESVWGGAEVIDSRYQDFRFTAGDVAADNASSGAFVTGPIGLPPADLDLALEAVLVEVGGVVVDSATGAAVQGHPGEALALAANDLARRGHAIEAGLDRAHRRHDGCRVRASRLEHRAALHQPRLGLPQRREGLSAMPLIEVTMVEGRTPRAGARPDLRADPRRRREPSTRPSRASGSSSARCRPPTGPPATSPSPSAAGPDPRDALRTASASHPDRFPRPDPHRRR